MNSNELKLALQRQPEQVEFTDTMAVIDAGYEFTPTAFSNGELHNAAGENNGSCKIFAFARLQGLTPAQTLACFGAYYREQVLANPTGQDHQNIRNFIKYGWAGIHYEGQPLSPKTS